MYLQRCLVVTWLVPRETAAVSARSVYTIQPCTRPYHFMQNHIAIYLSFYLSIYLSLSVCLSVCLYPSLYLSISVYLSLSLFPPPSLSFSLSLARSLARSVLTLDKNAPEGNAADSFVPAFSLKTSNDKEKVTLPALSVWLLGRSSAFHSRSGTAHTLDEPNDVRQTKRGGVGVGGGQLCPPPPTPFLS